MATIVGRPEMELLEGTDGADVIVTNGAIEVDAHGGDDLVCVTGKAPPFGASVVLGPGSDQLLGNLSGDDYVYADDEAEGEVDRDIIFTGGGNDYVATGSQERGAIASQDQIELGGGRDHLNLNGPVSLAATSSGGAGRDLIYWPAIAPRGVAVAVDNVREELRLNDDVVMEWDGFEIFRALPGIQGPFTFRGSSQGETLGGPVFFVEDRWKVDVRMGGGRDWVTIIITGAGAGTQIDGGGGADRLIAHSLDSAVVRGGVAIYGRAGNDRLIGSDRSDRLRGGRGHDVADGRDATDQCRAEVRTRCES
ncbi:hypothetical protein [Nocardioides sp. zg-1230]|uniref:hypothetical protein n=1 Tax=Nocardioides sp. zg-1230 TaxID=2736601 RepID=UPI001556D9DD|nr:hypothetical protein [Nocardioides sp. zg-1230]